MSRFQWTAVRYVAVALLAYGVDVGIFDLFLAGFGLGILAANVAAKISTGVAGFFGHRYFTFQAASHKGLVIEAIKFSTIAALNVPIATSLLYMFSLFMPNVLIAKIMGDCLCVLLTFFISKKFIFKSGK